MRSSGRTRVLAVAFGVAGFAALATTTYLSLNPAGEPAETPGPTTEARRTEGPVAALWVDVDGGACTRRSPPAAYDSASACGSFQDAYAAAAFGDTVRVTAGRYGEQALHYLPSKSSEADEPDVTFTANEGRKSVVVDSITGSGLRHVTFEAITVLGAVLLECEDNGVPADARGQHPVDITVRDSQIGTVRSENARLVRVIGNTIGPSDTVIKVGASADSEGGDCTDEPPVDILFESNDIHDFREASADAHMECIFVEGTQGLAIRRNIIRGCSVFAIFFKQQLSAGQFGMSNIVIENNMIGRPVASAFRQAGTTSLSFSGDENTRYTRVAVRHNSINGSVLVRDDLGVVFTDSVFEGNLVRARGGSCSAGVWRGNAYLESGAACPEDLADGVPSGWVDEETATEIRSADSDPEIDYHLKPGAWSIGRAVTKVVDDFDGDRRPIGERVDVGADERE